ncbi:MAG: amino acid ABC transporter ATP-binding protein [Lachnospiraceae bacterium]|nr:amino acid ABC transporter ATP-binding protein [Lachnospiraceae bacterium]
MIEIKNLRKEYATVTPLKDVTLTINDGDVISVIGPSGTGKSTFIRCINLLERPTGGQILLDGEDITAPGFDVRFARRKIGMVFQSFNLFSHLTVVENLMLSPVELLKKSRQEAYDKAVDMLARVGLYDKLLAYPDELSGGQKQRVAIARTLCMEPEVILLDEPTSALDPTMVDEVQSVIRDLGKSGTTMMIVTHEMNFARAISNRVIYMDEGGIYEEGTPEEIFDEPKKELTRRFIQRLKVFETLIDSKGYDLIAMGSALDAYLAQNDLAASERSRIRLAIEELVLQILLPRYEKPFIRIKAEYSPAEGECMIYVSYKGERFDIKDTDNTISLAVLKNAAGDISYSYRQGDEEPNLVAIRIG